MERGRTRGHAAFWTRYAALVVLLFLGALLSGCHADRTSHIEPPGDSIGPEKLIVECDPDVAQKLAATKRTQYLLSADIRWLREWKVSESWSLFAGFDEAPLADVYASILRVTSFDVQFAKSLHPDMTVTVLLDASQPRGTVADLLDLVARATNTRWHAGPGVVYVDDSAGNSADDVVVVTLHCPGAWDGSTTPLRSDNAVSLLAVAWHLRRELGDALRAGAAVELVNSRTLRVTARPCDQLRAIAVCRSLFEP